MENMKRLSGMLRRLPSIITLVFVGVTVASVAFVLEKLYQGDPRVFLNWPTIFSLMVLLLTTIAAAYVVHLWLKQRGTQSESRNYVILVLLATYAFSLLGVLNYVAYRFEDSAFVVNESVSSLYSSQLDEVRTRRLQRSKGVIDLWQELAEHIRAFPRPTFGSRDEFESYAAKDGFEVDFIPRSVTKAGTTPWTFQVRKGDREGVVSSSLDFTLAGTLLSDLEHDRWPILKFQLALICEDASVSEQTRWIDRIESARRDGVKSKLPLSLFLYQSAMDGLDSNPEYFVPASPTTRTLSFLSAIARYLFFGFFVSMLASSWSRPSA